MPMLAGPDELSFRSVIRRVIALAHQIADVVAAWSRDQDDGGIVGLTLRQLEVMARLHLTAGLFVVRDPWASHVTDAHVRPLLELYAHTAWVCEKVLTFPGTTAEARATCLQVRWAQHAEREVRIEGWEVLSDETLSLHTHPAVRTGQGPA